jgi:hypothetical protein
MDSTLDSLKDAEASLTEARNDAPLGTSIMIAERESAIRELINRIQRIQNADGSQPTEEEGHE